MKKIETKYIVAIIISVILGTSILGYGYMDYKYKKEALEQKVRSEEQAKEEEKQEAFDKNQKYLTCKMWANEDYHSNWVKECKSRGLKEDCSLPLENADRLNDSLEKDIDNCFKSIYTK
jgi:hypothetical protein